MNKLYANQLPQQLQQELALSYIVFGDEPLQLQESLDHIRRQAKQQGYLERQQFKVDAQFDWGQLTSALQSLSLFSDRRLIELDLSQQKLTTASSNELKSLAALLHPDTLLLIFGDRSPAEVARQSWLKAFPANTVFVSIYPLDDQQFRQWLQQQLRQEKLQLSADAMQLFLHHCSGNMLAARQNLDKLLLTFGPCQLDEPALTAFLSDQSSFTIFQLSDALLAGHSQQAFHRLERLCGQDEEPTLIGWQLQREVQNLLQLQQVSAAERSALFKKLGIWPKRQPLYQQALQRLPLKWLHYIVQELAAFDRLYKGGQLPNSQLALTHLTALFIAPVAKAYSLRHHDID
ncbi:DNA polymerase III subunit delta [Alkalimonas collagenimarina]|uniref:DNA polymerase III subunit delta n=1 Tax=Alkalimonas collagenimarina TaxID=400390 RepID=A0ABT9H1B8_9GAMM|nr:DNA polymerase III subunit delta [Alkalimonas collagenimarina]MDP4537090.1 DNA polymerase III subunit delta [Alkalimonas collagenimarina]